MIGGCLTVFYRDCGIQIEASDPSALVWLREFLIPDFEERSSGSATHRITFRSDFEEFASLRRRGRLPGGGSVGCFALDGRVASHPLWNHEREGVLVYDPTFRTFYWRKQNSPSTEITTTPGNLAARTALLRVVREVASAHVVNARGLLLHASAIANERKGYVIAGSKGAGKTTLLLYLLSNTPSELVTSDRVVIWEHPAGGMLRGMPTIVNVRRSSLEWYPKLAKSFEAMKYHHRSYLDEAPGVEDTAVHPERSWSITPSQFARLLGVSRSSEVPLTAVIFPRQTGRPGGVRLHRLRPEEFRRRLRSALFRPRSSALVGELFSDLVSQRVSDQRDAICRELAGRTAGFECELGLGAYDDDGAASALLASAASPGDGPTDD